MVVNILVYIEGSKNIERMAEVNVSRNGHVTLEDREEVCRTDYRVNVDHRHNPVSILINVRLHNPQAIVGVRFVEHFGKAVDECTRK